MCRQITQIMVTFPKILNLLENQTRIIASFCWVHIALGDNRSLFITKALTGTSLHQCFYLQFTASSVYVTCFSRVDEDERFSSFFSARVMKTFLQQGTFQLQFKCHISVILIETRSELLLKLGFIWCFPPYNGHGLPTCTYMYVLSNSFNLSSLANV